MHLFLSLFFLPEINRQVNNKMNRNNNLFGGIITMVRTHTHLSSPEKKSRSTDVASGPIHAQVMLDGTSRPGRFCCFACPLLRSINMTVVFSFDDNSALYRECSSTRLRWKHSPWRHFFLLSSDIYPTEIFKKREREKKKTCSVIAVDQVVTRDKLCLNGEIFFFYQEKKKVEEEEEEELEEKEEEDV